jgi:hypothetical protein
MTTRERLFTALTGGTPDRTPFTFIDRWMGTDMDAPAWRRLMDQGLGVVCDVKCVRAIEHGVRDTHETLIRDGVTCACHTRHTPVGSIHEMHTNGWKTDYFVKEPRDYKVLQWIVEHTELVADYDPQRQADARAGSFGVAPVVGSRSPMLGINVEWTGAEQFALDLAQETPELFELFHARRRLFLEETRLIARGPGDFVKWIENLMASLMGPRRYRDWVVSVYRDAVPILEAAGKRVFVHYDGVLSVLRDEIADAPFHGIESLTEPPEGDMMYDECRAAWPDKVFWANLNLGCYSLPPDQLRAEVRAKLARAGRRGVVLGMSEDLPGNWQQTIPVILDELQTE